MVEQGCVLQCTQYDLMVCKTERTVIASYAVCENKTQRQDCPTA